MKTIKVSLKENSYSIVVGEGILSKLPSAICKLSIGTDAVVITNPLVRRLHGKQLEKAFLKSGFSVKTFEVEDAESAKSLQVAFGLIDKIVRYAAGKKIFIVVFGGGVVGDLAGFVAAVIKRGVPFVQVPTTLLSQIDSSIGGKVAVDLPSGKNLVGAFYQPKLVWSDTALLKTLSVRQIRNGLSEAVKYGAIRDQKLFTFIEKNHKPLLEHDLKALTHVVHVCAGIKADIVSKDEKETKGLRTILNFGHTVGHAIEATTKFEKYQHGEAVALGIKAAVDISCQLKLLKPIDAARINCLFSALGLPEAIEGMKDSQILSAMKFDKKFSGKKNRFVLLKSIGTAVVKEGIPEAVILRAIQEIINPKS